jgi:uncharacterized protein (TIGR03435 family)
MKLLVIAALVSPAIIAQGPAVRFTFEVASVKAIEPSDPSISGPGPKPTGLAATVSGDPIHITYPHVTLIGLLTQAYSVNPRLIEGPDWIRTQFYNVIAKVPDNAPKGHTAEMLQNLLSDRFHVVVHWETREESGFELIAGKTGPKLKKSEVDENGIPLNRNSSMNSSGRFTWKGATLDQLANSLSVDLGRSVVNKTGIAGYFDITLEAAPDSMPGLPNFGSRPDSPLPSIFTAIHELGLTLEPQKVSARRLVVDSAQKTPTEN